jgi:PTS system N-acetylglucosamine-specific IIC component
LLLIPIGIVYFILYYAVFRICIVRFGLSTPGRDSEDAASQPVVAAAGTRGASFVTALGGAGNLNEVEACTTRLRLVLADNRAIDELLLKQLGSRGLLRASTTGLQVVLGPIADQVAGEIRMAIRTGGKSSSAAVPTPSADALLAALGGRGNVSALECLAGRVAVRVTESALVDERALLGLGVRGVARANPNSLQLLVPGSVEDWAQPLRRALA